MAIVVRVSHAHDSLAPRNPLLHGASERGIFSV
jgi:hypothetical protein